MATKTSPAPIEANDDEWAPTTEQEWAEIAAALVRTSTQSSSTVPFELRVAPASTPTGDGGALLILSAPSNQPLGTYLYLRPWLVAQPPHLQALRWMRQATGFSQERIAVLLGVSRQTLHQWQRGEPIKDANRQRVFGVRSVLERAQLRHQTRGELVAWLDTPRGADGRTPAQCLAAGDLDRARLLAVSMPSPRVQRAPSWVRSPVAPAFRAGAEHMQEALPPEPFDEPDLDASATDNATSVADVGE